MTERFVSFNGVSGLYTRANPGHCAGAIALSVADDIITALDGTYTGANYMITVNSKSGTSGHPITFRADNDGGVLIDGEFSRTPVSLDSGSSWWVLEGFDARNSNADVVDIGNASNNNIVRRVVAWNADESSNADVFSIYTSSTNNLLEDCAGFGSGRKIYQAFSSCNNLIFRRCFGQFTKTTSLSGPKSVISIAYDSQNNLAENMIATWDEDPGNDGIDHYGMFTENQVNRFDFPPGDNHVSNSTFLGCIGFFLSTQAGTFQGGFQGGGAVEGVTYEDCAIFIDHADAATASLINFDTSVYSSNPNDGHNLTNVTEIDTAGDDSLVESDWDQTNRKVASSVAAVYGGQSIYNNDGTKGATINFRYVNGVLTDVPLWPWPMNQRIIDAMTLAGRTPIDVMEIMESIFGVPPDVDPGHTFPVDNFNTYATGVDLNGNGGGSGTWSSDWTTVGNGAMTVETAPAGGMSGKAVRSNSAAGALTSYYRTFLSVSSGTVTWGMQSSITNPNDDTYGWSLHESGVSERCTIQFSGTGNIRAYDYMAAAWVNVLVGYSANTLYSMALEIDAVLHPGQYRVSANGGAYTSWIWAYGTMTVLNHIQINDWATNAHTLWGDNIGGAAAPDEPALTLMGAALL